MPIAAWIALASLFVAVSIQGLLYAYFMGRLTQRVSSLESAGSRDAELFEKVIRLDERQQSGNDKLEALHRDMGNIQRQLANLSTKGGISPFAAE